jgi:hypothetical protein
MAEFRGAIQRPLQGRNGRLFLGAQDGFDLEMFARSGLFNAPMLGRWRRALTRRGAALAARGIPYVFFIVPDAPSVYPEDLPNGLERGFRPPGEIFLQAVGDIENVTFVYPLRQLREAKGGLEIYQKNDTHWTAYGSYVGYRALMAAVEKHVPCRTVPARDVQFSFRRSYGDLGSLMEPEQAQEIPVVRISGPEVTSTVQHDGVARQTSTESRFADQAARSRAIVFRDSFFTDLAPYVARSFAELLTLGTTTRMMMDLVERFAPDVVISQVAERKLCFLESDHQLEGYDTLYRGGYGSPVGKRLLQARIVMPADRAGALRMIENDDAQLRENAEHAFGAALIHEAAGRLQSADDLAQSALAARPENASFLALAARTALACGRLGQAAELAAAAAARGPYNGYFHELLVYCLMQNGQAPAALEAAEAALAHITDHANLWYWASVLQEAIGHPGRAVEHAAEAVKLDPEHQLYATQMQKLEAAAQLV